MTYEELELFTHEELSTLRYCDISLDKFVLLKKNADKEINLSKNLEEKIKKLIDDNIDEYKKIYGEHAIIKSDTICKLSNLSTLFLNILRIGKELAPQVSELIDLVLSHIQQ